MTLGVGFLCVTYPVIASAGEAPRVSKSRSNASAAEPLTQPPPEGVVGDVDDASADLERKAAEAMRKKNQADRADQDGEKAE